STSHARSRSNSFTMVPSRRTSASSFRSAGPVKTQTFEKEQSHDRRRCREKMRVDAIAPSGLVLRVSEEHQVWARPHLEVKVGLEIAVEEIRTDFPTVIVLVAEHAACGKNRESHVSSFQLSDHFALDLFAVYEVGVKLHVPGCAGPVGQ